MRTRTYDHRNGLKVVPKDIVDTVEKVVWEINPSLSKNSVTVIKDSIRERLEKEWWSGE